MDTKRRWLENVVSQTPSHFSENIDESVENLTSTILTAASESIPVTSTVSKSTEEGTHEIQKLTNSLKSYRI